MMDALDKASHGSYAAPGLPGSTLTTRPSFSVDRSPYQGSTGGFIQHRVSSGGDGSGNNAVASGSGTGPRGEIVSGMKRPAMAMDDSHTGHASQRRRRESVTSTGTYEDEGSQDHRRESSATASRGNGNGHGDRQPKRGARACTNCRRGKNRCEGEKPCRRCAQHGLECVFEKPTSKKSEAQGHMPGSGDVEGRINHIESSVSNLASSQGQMQATLSQILAALSQQNPSQGLQQYPPQPLGAQGFSPLPLGAGGDPASTRFPFAPMDSPSSGQYSQFGMGGNSNARPSPASSGMQSGQQPFYGNTLPPLAGGQNQGMPFSPATNDMLNQVVGQTTGYQGDSAGDFRQTDYGDQANPARYTPRRNNGVTFADNGDDRGGGYRRSPKAEQTWPEDDAQRASPPRKFPKFHGFAPPPHRYAQYGLMVASTAPSSEDESEDTLPRGTLDAPIEALQALASAADQAAQDEKAQQSNGSGFLSPPRVLQNRTKLKKRKRPEPTPRNAFPDVITKGLVSESEARELWQIFFSGCHYFVPMFDQQYDVFEGFYVRTPFSFDGMLAVAAKIRAGTSPPGQTYYKCLEEAQGIARSTLFGPVVRKEAVMAVLILAAWSQNGWLPSGHALRMGLDMQLHKALDKLADAHAKERSDTEERDLVVAARIWLNVYLNDHIISLGTGRPLMLRDDESVRNARLLLTHAMGSETDLRLISCVELVGHKVRVYETLHSLRGKIDHSTIGFVRRCMNDLVDWHKQWHDIHIGRHAEDSVLVKLLRAELCYAQLWTACVALRGCAFDKLTFEQRELAFQAKDAALACLSTYQSQPLRGHLKYAVHETMVQISFSCTFLLKVAILFPSELPAAMISKQVNELAELLSECAAERYSLTLRLMLRSFRRKMGEVTRAPGSPRPASASANGQAVAGGLDSAGLQSLLSGDSALGTGDFATMDDIGPFNFPLGFSPSALPPWITETNMTDLGLPWEGSDAIFLPPELANMFLPTPTTWQLSEEPGAEAW